MSLENNETFENEQNNLTEQVKEQNSELYEENFEGDYDNETENQKSQSNLSKIILYIIYSIVIILCLIVLAKNLFFKNNGENTKTSSTSESAVVNTPEKIMDLYVLADLADGYELVNQDVSETKAVSTYKNKTTEIAFTQSTIDGYKPEYDASDEDIVVSKFSTGDGQDYTAYQIDGKCYIVWTTNEYTFEIKTSLKKSESIPFIFNVQKAEDASSASESA